MADREALEVRYGRLIARAWTDDHFREKLVSSPLDAFGEYDIRFPDGKQVRVLENTTTLIYLPLHVKPRPGEEPLMPVMGGLPAWYEDLVSRAWADESFKRRLLTEPEAVYRERGIDLPAGITTRWAEDTEQLLHVPMPLRPPVEELSNEQQQDVVGFYCASHPWIYLVRKPGTPYPPITSAHRG